MRTILRARRVGRLTVGCAGVVAVAALLAAAPSIAFAQSSAAQSMADRFARDKDSAKSSAKTAKVPVPVASKAVQPEPSAEDRARADLVRRQLELADDERDLAAREAAMLARAHAESVASAPDAKSIGDPGRVLEDQRLKDLADDSARRESDAARATARAQQHEEELARLSERIRAAQARRAAQILARNVPRPSFEPDLAESAHASVLTGTGPASHRDESVPVVTRAPRVDDVKTTGRAAVLLVMSPGSTGIRRFAKTADPVLCIGPQCYVSQGADRSADAKRVSLVLGAGNTLGKRAAACNHTLGCVFRNVDIGRTADVQPVDMHILKHDRREIRSVTVDSTCHMERGRLSCSGGVRGATYTMWVVPEELVAHLSPSVLEAAIASGLPPPSTAAAALR